MTFGRRIWLLLALTAQALALAGPDARGQEWPTRPIRMVVGFPAGGSADVVARVIGQKLSERLGRSVVVESITSGAGLIASDTVAKSPPDGHTMVLLTGGHPVMAVSRKSLPYDSVADFGMVSIVTSYPMLLVVRPDSPIKSFPDLIARAKAAPDKITLTTLPVGTVHYLLAQWINLEASISMTPVPYRGAAAGATADLIAGRVDVMIDTATTAMARVHSGELRALAVSSPARYRLAPEVPTLAETLPGVATMSWLGVAVAPGTPPTIINRLNREIRLIVEMPDVVERLTQFGGIASPSTPEDMQAQIAREIASWERVVEQKQIPKQ